jgi:hypothetical protein
MTVFATQAPSGDGEDVFTSISHSGVGVKLETGEEVGVSEGSRRTVPAKVGSTGNAEGMMMRFVAVTVGSMISVVGI